MIEESWVKRKMIPESWVQTQIRLQKIITSPVMVNHVPTLAAWCTLYGNGTINQYDNDGRLQK